MTSEAFCQPCQKLLSEDNTKHYYEVPHHLSPESFAEALRLPCSICSLLWADLEALNFTRDAPPSRTSYSVLTGDNEDAPEEREIRFQCDQNMVAIYIVPWDSMCHSIPNLLSDNTGSEEALSFLYEKYRKCQDNHEQCQPRHSGGLWYPTRVIDVGDGDKDRIYLRETKTFGDQGPYFTASHCWGKSNPLALTKDTEPKLRAGIHVDELPKTFQDAVTMTRKLNVRYIWIDSLCIYQDNIDDWSTEASCMRDVYSRAACNIAATAAPDSEAGLFFRRNPALLRPCRIEASWAPAKEKRPHGIGFPPAGSYWCDRFCVWTDLVENSPLNSRAWVCQERYLSPRIMHFGSTQLFWECKKVIASELYPDNLPLWAMPFWTEDASVLKRTVSELRKELVSPLASESLKFTQRRRGFTEKPVTLNQLYNLWAIFRISYTTCQMTMEEDKLVAISGIAQDIAEILNDQLVAGLWRNHILEELCWFKFIKAKEESPPPPKKWRAPTWSWASTNGRIWISTLAKFHADCSGRHTMAELVDLDVNAKLSGELTHASIKIRCNPICVSLEREANAEPDFTGRATLKSTGTTIRITSGLPDTIQLSLDEPTQESSLEGPVYFVLIQRCPHEVSPERYFTNCVEGLLLLPKQGEENVFQRKGQFYVDREVVRKLLDEHGMAERKVIEIV